MCQQSSQTTSQSLLSQHRQAHVQTSLWWCICLIVLSASSALPCLAHPVTPHKIKLLNATTYLGAQGRKKLQYLLQLRGFVLCQKTSPCGTESIGMTLKDNGELTLSHQRAQRLFRIPQRYKKDDVRARAVIALIGIFTEWLSEHRSQQGKSVISPNPPARRRRIRRSRRRKAPGRTTPKRPAPITRPIVRKVTPPRHRARRAKLAQLQRSQPLAPRHNALRVEFAAGGSLGFQGSHGWPIGGWIQGGPWLRAWSLQAAISAHQITAVEGFSMTAMSPELRILWRPLTSSRGLVSLVVEAGICFDLLWASDQQRQLFQWRLGTTLATRAEFHIARHWSLFVRPSFSIFSKEYLFEQRGQLLYKTHIWSFALQIGAAFAFAP